MQMGKSAHEIFWDVLICESFANSSKIVGRPNLRIPEKRKRSRSAIWQFAPTTRSGNLTRHSVLICHPEKHDPIWKINAAFRPNLQFCQKEKEHFFIRLACIYAYIMASHDQRSTIIPLAAKNKVGVERRAGAQRDAPIRGGTAGHARGRHAPRWRRATRAPARYVEHDAPHILPLCLP